MARSRNKSMVQFGAGNIGRSFIGQLFSRAGYEVVFVDVNTQLVQQLNTAGSYTVIFKAPGREEKVSIDSVRAVDGRDLEAVADFISQSHPYL
jgi:mannitol-1-phosphate 5-dehydrogenase